MNITNLILMAIVIGVAVAIVHKFITNKQKQEVEEQIQVDDATYTLSTMTEFVKKRLDEITKINLYDIGLSEEELKRRKNKKYELKKALKGCTYGDVNDKKYIKELIYDMLYNEYGVDEINVSKAIPFDVPSLLTAQDKFDIILYMYKSEFGYEALSEIIKKYKLDELKYVAGESKPSYVITPEEISDIYEKENFALTFQDKLSIVVQRIYQHYKGYSSIDEIRDMNIDGISGGVSGLPESFLSQVAQTDGDYLSQIKGIIESEYPTTENFIYVGGKLTQYKWIDEEFDNVYALLDFTYDQQLNNLNLDLFGIILADYFENIEDLFLYDITGKRSVYLPEKVKVSGIDDEDGKYEYSVSFKYEVKDNYITKAIIDEDGEKYEYEIFYEN